MEVQNNTLKRRPATQKPKLGGMTTDRRGGNVQKKGRRVNKADNGKFMAYQVA